jgi:glucosyl-3-phosphoglycerate synthase
MSDFYQNGVVTVLHRLGEPNIDRLEQELERHARTTPIALVLPTLYAELERPALKRIVETLQHIRYLNEMKSSSRLIRPPRWNSGWPSSSSVSSPTGCG